MFDLSLQRTYQRKPTSGSTVFVGELSSIERLECRTLPSGTPIAAQYRFDNNIGIDQITVEGKRLLIDAGRNYGMALIGSATGTDDQNNISSDTPPYNGVMHQMNGSNSVTLPFSLSFRTDPKDASKIYYDVTLGPAPQALRTVSFPLAGTRANFDKLQWAGSSATRNYRDLPYFYTPPNAGPYQAVFAPSNTAWGEAIGPDYTIRVGLISHSKPMTLAFVEAPSLDVGVRDIEYGIPGLAKGERVSFSGYVQTFRTDPAIYSQTPLTFQAESQLSHQIGRREGDGWSVRLGDTTNKYLSYGPYTTDVQAGNRTANFRLQIDNNTASNSKIAVIDIYDANTGKVLARRDIYRRDFASALKYQDFNLTFRAESNMRLEGRVLWLGGAYLKQDFLRIS